MTRTIGIVLVLLVATWGQNYKTIFNGEDLTGWHYVTGEDTAWRAEEGHLVGRHFGTDAYDHLSTDSLYENFTLRFKFLWITGNSGFFFRGEETGSSGMSGHQVLTTGDRDAAGLWETHGRNWIIQPDDRLRSFYKQGEWNQWVIHAYDRHITVILNDSLIGDLPDDPGRTLGHFGVKLHGGGAESEVHIRNIHVADTTRTGCTDSSALNYDKWAWSDNGNCEFNPLEVLPGWVSGHGRDLHLKFFYDLKGCKIRIKKNGYLALPDF